MSLILAKTNRPSNLDLKWIDKRSAFVDPFSSWLDGLFNDLSMETFFGNDMLKKSSFPKLDVVIDPKDNSLIIDAALPGLSFDEIDVNINDSERILTIRNKPRTKGESSIPTGNFVIREIKRTSFERSLRIPDQFDLSTSSAAFNNGILTVSVKIHDGQVKIPTNRSLEITRS